MVKDKLFLLSKKEVKNLLSKKDRRCRYAVERGRYWWWWLRTPGYTDTNVIYVTPDGILHDNGIDVIYPDVSVRPALYINVNYLQSLERTKKGYVEFGGIKWKVLNEETGLLLAKVPICRHCFDENTNDYEDSKIRAYLNNDLVYGLFTDEEREMIVDAVIDGEKSRPAA